MDIILTFSNSCTLISILWKYDQNESENTYYLIIKIIFVFDKANRIQGGNNIIWNCNSPKHWTYDDCKLTWIVLSTHFCLRNLCFPILLCTVYHLARV